MNLKITKSALLVALLGISGSVLAQETPTSTGSRFSTQDFRTWSIGVHGGALTPRTLFDGKLRDFQTAKENVEIGSIGHSKSGFFENTFSTTAFPFLNNK